MRILLIDDEEDIRLVVSVSLETIGGFKVITAANGIEAMALAKEERPDVILLDFMMPDISGPELLQKFRQEQELEKIPVIFLTAKSKPPEVKKLLGLGAKGVIGKPFDPAHLANEVKRILNS